MCASCELGVLLKQSIAQALQFALSDMKGSLYLAGASKFMAEEIGPYKLTREDIVLLGLRHFSAKAVSVNVEAIVNVKYPQVFKGYSGQYHANHSQLVNTADLILELRVFDTVSSDMCIPSTHPANVCFRFSLDKATTEADVIVIIDCNEPCIRFRSIGRKG